MIGALRRRHRRLALALGVVPPLTLVAALLARPARSGDADVIFPRLTGADRPATPLRVAAGFPLDVRLAADGAAAGPTLGFVIAPAAPLRAPDPLLYWVPSRLTGDSLPSTAVLIGSVGAPHAVQHVVSADRLGREGYLVLWSGAWGRPIASSPVSLEPLSPAVSR
jgi:hypothetical protein